MADFLLQRRNNSPSFAIAPTLAALLQAGGSPSQAQTKIIFDTDITGDADDVLALAMLHALADRGECEIVAVTISKINPLTGRSGTLS